MSPYDSITEISEVHVETTLEDGLCEQHGPYAIDAGETECLECYLAKQQELSYEGE